MGEAVFPPYYLPGPNYGGGNEDNGDLPQKTPCMHCYTLAPDPAAGQRRPTPRLGTPGHPQASLGQSPVGSLLLFPGSWCTRFCCALQETIFQSCVSSGRPMVWVMATSSMRAYSIPSLMHPEPLYLGQSTADLYLYRRLSNTVLFQSLWGPWVLVCTKLV